MSIRISKGIVKDARNCTICGKEKSLDAFSKLSSGKLGRHAHCKDCRNKRRKACNYTRQKGVRMCPKCKQTKDCAEYSSDKGSKTGLQTYCKPCQRKMCGRRATTLDDYVTLIYKDLINNAKKRKISVAITKEDILRLYEEQNGLCALTGIAMTHSKIPGMGRQAATFKNISVDRIDSSGEYTLDNVQLVCCKINTIKWDIPQEEFIDACKSVIEYHYGIKIRTKTEIVFHDAPET